MKPTKEQQAESMEFLTSLLKPGDKVYTILRHVSRSGMSRRISTIYIKAAKPGDIAEKWNAEPMDISPAVARVLELRYDYNQNGMRIDGCGMDMEKKERIQRLWCQHCKAMQKTNNTVVECWYNPLDREAPAFCASNEDFITALEALDKIK